MKKSLIFLVLFSFTATVFCFNWPQDNISKENIKSYFGQNRGKILSNSVVFCETENVKVSEPGKLILIYTENDQDSDFFPSTLGTAVILSHDDNLISVYGNMETESLCVNEKSNLKIDEGADLGKCGNTGWQDQKSGLEFQILDTKNSSAINPKVLMTRTEDEIPLSLSGIYISNKKGDFFDLNSHKTLQAGLYRIYQKRNTTACPYKTTVTINGIESDLLCYDLLIGENGKTCVNGKKKYTSLDVYPDEKLQLLGEATFTPGKTTLSLAVSDILDNHKALNYNVTIY